MSALNLFAFVIQMFWVPDLILCFSLWQIAFSKRWIPPVVPPIPPAPIYMWMMPSPGWVPSPHIWLGACDYSNPKSEEDMRLWNIWGYHRRDMTTTWFSWLRHLTLDPWRLCWETGKKDHIIVETHVWEPNFSVERDALRQQTHRWRSLWEEPSHCCRMTYHLMRNQSRNWRVKPRLCSQLRNHERWKWIAVDSKSLNVGVSRYLA